VHGAFQPKTDKPISEKFVAFAEFDKYFPLLFDLIMDIPYTEDLFQTKVISLEYFSKSETLHILEYIFLLLNHTFN
jgi:hypothetical protein